MASEMRLTVDVGPLLEDQWTGIPVFTRRLVQALAAAGLELDFAYELMRLPADKVWAAIRLGAGSFLREDFELRAAKDYRLVDPNVPIFYPSTKKDYGVIAREASTVHDMSTLVMPENHEASNVAHHLDGFDTEMATDEVIFCVSEATRAALEEALPSTKSRTQVIYQYVDWPESFELLDRNLPPLRLGRYAVVVGTVEPRKNLRLLIDALPVPQVARMNLSFVVIGRKGWLVDSFLASLTEEDRTRLVFSGFVSEFVKYRLIKGAEFLVFPSLYEGFGIPAVEAMSLGKPVLAARTSSFPEVIGQAGIYFDPFSTTEFVDALQEIANARRLRELAPIALTESRKFSASRMAAPVAEWVSHH